MTTTPFHDYTVESILVDATERRLVLRAFDAHASQRIASVAEFTGVACYHFEGDFLGTILFAITASDAMTLYERYARRLQQECAATGAHEPWVATSKDARAFIGSNSILGFELLVSIGAPGAIWCRDLRTWSDNGTSA